MFYWPELYHLLLPGFANASHGLTCITFINATNMYVFSAVDSVVTPWLLSMAAVHSVSFAASTQSDCSSWMGEDVKIPVRGFGLPSVLLQEKKGTSMR